MNGAVEALFARQAQGIKPGLEVMEALLQALDNPHRRLAVVHVAGTNGKGSVCAMLESVLRASSIKTGLYTSPHLIDFSERFLVNGQPISWEMLNGYIGLMEQKAGALERTGGLRAATFFEISTAIAFQYFFDQQVDIAIVETGMGGKWDATNVVIPLISVITRIDIDHTHFLGNTVEAIAAEKAAIIKPGRPAVSAPQSAPAMAALRERAVPILLADEAVSIMKVASPQKVKIESASLNLPPINLPIPGACQRENCAVAVTVLEVLAGQLQFEPEFKKGLENMTCKARFQFLEAAYPTILDGAHNPSAACALAKTLRELYPQCQVGFIFGFLKEKNPVEFLRPLKPLISAAWTISIEGLRGTTAAEAASQCKTAGVDAWPADVPTAWKAAQDWAAESGRIVVITGSLYLAHALHIEGYLQKTPLSGGTAPSNIS